MARTHRHFAPPRLGSVRQAAAGPSSSSLSVFLFRPPGNPVFALVVGALVQTAGMVCELIILRGTQAAISYKVCVGASAYTSLTGALPGHHLTTCRKSIQSP
ncbi:hypothetical protein NTGM5_70077 [Candidatus Nitrotoga sp. M5]|nr:hypothetical protein NTGM5_70077 [Candidatus Nitrotoga sp. M5]